MPIYRLRALCDVRAWIETDMEFTDDAAARAHVDGLAATIRTQGYIPPDHPIEDAAFETDFHPCGYYSLWLDEVDADGEIIADGAEVEAWTPRELAEQAAPDMLAALKLVEPVAEDALTNAQEALDNSDLDDPTLRRELIISRDAAKNAHDAVRAAIAKAEGRNNV